MSDITCPLCSHKFDPEAEKTLNEASIKTIRAEQKDQGLRSVLTWLTPKDAAKVPNLIDIRCPNCKRYFEFDVDEGKVYDG